MSAAEDESSKIDALFNELCEAILRAAKDGPHKTVDLKDMSRGELEDFKATHPDAEYETTEWDDDPVSARYPVREAGKVPLRFTFYLAVDEIGQGYGGPEEGGWWYDHGTVVTHEAVRINWDPVRGGPWLKEGEKDFLHELATEWLRDYDFDTNYRTSMAPRGADYRWRVAEAVPEDWNNYAPYC